MKNQKGIAMGFVLVMLLLLSIAGAGVLMYVRGSSELVYREVKKDIAYYAAEAGIQKGLYEASAKGKQGTQPVWDFSVGGQTLPVQYTITTNQQDGTTSVSATVNTDTIKVQ